MSAKKCFLRPLDASHDSILLIDNTPLTLGRGPLTKIRDSRCSRSQVIITAQYEKNLVKATQIGRNACGFNGQEIEVDKSILLKHGEIIEILSGQFGYMIDFDPPPGKKIVEDVSKRKVDDVSDSDDAESGPEPAKHAKLENSSSTLGEWSTVENELFIFKSCNVQCRPKIAAFDLDYTLISTKSQCKFPVNENDWQLLCKNTVSKLETLQSDGFKIVIFTNQGGINNICAAKKFKGKIEKISAKLKVPFEAYVSIGKGYNRKPCPGMWEVMTERNGGLEINMSESFYCGDAAGRVKSSSKIADFSQSDILFARNLNLKFFTPEEFFLIQKDVRAIRITSFDASSLPNDIPLCDPEDMEITSIRQELVILVGSPASGKSHFAKTHMIPNNYERVNRDELKTMARCLKEAEKFLNLGHRVVIDNTNGTIESRNKFISLALKFKIRVRAFVMKVSEAHAMHNNKFRQLTSNEHSILSEHIIHKYYQTYEEPTVAEGFFQIVKINFWPSFSKPEHEKLYKMFLLDK